MKSITELAKEVGYPMLVFMGTPYVSPELRRLVEAAIEQEREEIAQMIECAPPLLEFAQNDQSGCLMCGFTPKLAAKSIRARSNT